VLEDLQTPNAQHSNAELQTEEANRAFGSLPRRSLAKAG